MVYFTAGPSQLHPRLREFLDDALANDVASYPHRSEPFCDLFVELRKNLGSLLKTEGYSMFVAASGTEWMERTIQNMSTERTLHFVGGAFAERFFGIALSLGRNAIAVQQRTDGSFSIDDVPVDTNPELICLTHNETSNGTALTEDFFHAVRARFPDALIVVDVVSSAPLFPEVFSKADCLFFSVQKAFGLPAGLGVALVNERALQKAREVEKRAYVGSFHSFTRLAEEAAYNSTPDTPNVLGVYLLNRVVEDFLGRDLNTMRVAMNSKANVLHEAIRNASDLQPLGLDDAYRSKTVIVARAPSGSKSIIDRLAKGGFLISGGFGKDKDTHIRIANFPAHTDEMVERVASFLTV